MDEWTKLDRYQTLYLINTVALLHFVVVALLFYVHGKHLRSCRDGNTVARQTVLMYQCICKTINEGDFGTDMIPLF